MPRGSRKGSIVTGAILILLGGLFLLAQFVPFEDWIFLAGLGVIFLSLGWLLRRYGLLIPGGIVTGLAGGIGASRYLPEESLGAGATLVGIGVGFLLVWILGWLAAGEKKLWPLIPGGILVTVGALLLAGTTGLQILEWVGRAWPAILLVAGIAVLVSALRRPPEPEWEEPSPPAPAEELPIAAAEDLPAPPEEEPNQQPML